MNMTVNPPTLRNSTARMHYLNWPGPWCRVWTSLTQVHSTCQTGTSVFLLRLPKLLFRPSLWSLFPQSKQIKVWSVLCVCWSLRSKRLFEKCHANTSSTQDVYCPGWARLTPVLYVDLNYQLTIQSMKSSKKTRREENRGSTDWRIYMEQCTHDMTVQFVAQWHFTQKKYEKKDFRKCIVLHSCHIVQNVISNVKIMSMTASCLIMSQSYSKSDIYNISQLAKSNMKKL